MKLQYCGFHTTNKYLKISINAMNLKMEIFSEINEFLNNKSILITGGTGSFDRLA